LIDGPEAAPVTVLLAHGAGAAIDSPFTAAMASGLAGNWATAPGESSPRCL
jgi:predicted alpha/beta-hydrolase family hydrolase